jgi:hypothetical protein
MQGVFLSTNSNVDVQGVFLSTTSSLDLQGVFLSTTSSVVVQGVSKQKQMFNNTQNGSFAKVF